MSDQFKFLNQSVPGSSTSDKPNAAQSFLNEKLAKNRYTINQQEELDANGGSKDFGSQYQKVVTNQDAIDSFDAGSSQGGTGTLEERYAKKFGSSASEALANSHDAASANQIYDNIKSLESDDYWANQDLGGLMKKVGHQEHIVNIGNYTKDGGLAVNASIANGINFDNIQSQLDDRGWNGEKNNSIGQLGSALLAAGGTGGKADAVAPEAIEKMVKIEHSPEIKQAKERVQTYENDIMSGKTSDDIYKVSNNDQYSFDATKGAAGIGTPMNGSPKEQAQKATTSFLDNKKSQVKNQYQFQAQG